MNLKKKVATTAAIAILSTAFASGVSANTYTVQKGDSLSRIAITYNISVAELKRLNQLNSDLIRVQQTLRVSESSSVTAPTNVKPVAVVKVKTYTVVSGDSLSKIASRFSITVANLMAWNNLKSSVIHPGQVLKVANPTTPVTPKAPTTPTNPVKPTTPVAPPQVTITEYVVKSGDTLSKIGLQFKTTVAEIKALNKLRSDIIYVGQKLKVTAKVTNPSPTTPAPEKPTVPEYDPSALVESAKALVGIPYVWGGASLSGFDCSGYIYYVYNQNGKKLPRVNAQGYYDRSYYVDTPQPGDLIFFENTYKQGISHLGIYIGNNQFTHADSSGVRITDVSNGYYQKHFVGYKRFY